MVNEENIISNLKSFKIPSYEELYDIIINKLKHMRKSYAEKPFHLVVRDLELRRIDTVYHVLSEKLSCVKNMPPVKSLHPFYQEILSIEVDLDEYEYARRGILIALKVLKRVWRKYRAGLLTKTDLHEMAVTRKQAVGRMLSLFKRRNKQLLLLEKARLTLIQCPTVYNDPTIVVAGAPNVGKSTLTRLLSSARTKVAPYPFTTRTVIIGHRILSNGVRVQIIDTPGILDRPLDQMTEVERRAVAALRTLAHALIFILDPSPEAYCDVVSQLRILAQAETICSVPRDKLLILVNKADLVPSTRLRWVYTLLARLGYNILVTSLTTGFNVDKLLRWVENVGTNVARTLYAQAP